MCGTYTRGRSFASAGLTLVAVVSLYRLSGSATGGIPGTVDIGTTGAAACTFAGSCAKQVVEHTKASDTKDK
jgi:hypothetical protein